MKNKYYNDDGSPARIAVYRYDGDKYIDNYTFVFTYYHLFDERYRNTVYYISANASGSVYMHGSASKHQFGSCGKRIKWQDVSDGVTKRAVLEEYNEIWGEAA